jgi:hypothetical protein
MAIFNTSEQSGAFNHEYGRWASEPKARTPTVRECIISVFSSLYNLEFIEITQDGNKIRINTRREALVQKSKNK